VLLVELQAVLFNLLLLLLVGSSACQGPHGVR
jgi:hypothetical protein